MSQGEIIDVLDSQDKVVGKVPSERAHKEGLKHATVHILLFSDTTLSHILLCKRSSSEETSADKWHISAGGHVKSGESRFSAAHREISEELGINAITLYEVRTYDNKTREYNHESTTLFYGIYEDTPNFNAGEIQDYMWIHVSTLMKILQQFSPNHYTRSLYNAAHALLITHEALRNHHSNP